MFGIAPINICLVHGLHHCRCVVFSGTLWVYDMKIHACIICARTGIVRLVKHRLKLFLVRGSHNY